MRRAVPIAGLALTLCSCAQLQPRPNLPAEWALPAASDTEHDQLIARIEAQHPSQSAFRLLVAGPEAFVLRAHSAQHAQRSVDVQTYIWHGDLTGLVLVHRLLEAADRGVRVRLLVDDIDARANNTGFAALDVHPNIAVRLFNPFASRAGVLRGMAEALGSFKRLNRRMHNKSWIADNRIAVVGGRNLGDEYFGASAEVNFVDLDFAMFGPVVRDVSAAFDRYWNSPAAYPIALLDASNVNYAALWKLRAELSRHVEQAAASIYAQGLRSDDSVLRLAQGDPPLQWTASYRFVADDPGKIAARATDFSSSQVMQVLAPAMQASRRELNIISPYFVPGARGTAVLAETARTRQVRILTNSLVANDVAAVHGGYSRRRKALLEGGVQLWELKPLEFAKGSQPGLSVSSASLHTKAMILDDRLTFVGSYNLDPRSTWLNCEQGVLVESEVIAAQLNSIYAQHASGEHAWHVTLRDDELEWSDGAETFTSDPKATLGLRLRAWLARVLHLDAQL